MKLTLRVWRVNKGLSMREVAERLGVTEQTVASWERGTHLPDIAKATAMCQLYEVPIESVDFLLPNQ